MKRKVIVNGVEHEIDINEQDKTMCGRNCPQMYVKDGVQHLKCKLFWDVMGLFNRQPECIKAEQEAKC